LLLGDLAQQCGDLVPLGRGQRWELGNDTPDVLFQSDRVVLAAKFDDRFGSGGVLRVPRCPSGGGCEGRTGLAPIWMHGTATPSFRGYCAALALEAAVNRGARIEFCLHLTGLVACGVPIDKKLSVAPLCLTLEEVSGGERRASSLVDHRALRHALHQYEHREPVAEGG